MECSSGDIVSLFKDSLREVIREALLPVLSVEDARKIVTQLDVHPVWSQLHAAAASTQTLPHGSVHPSTHSLLAPAGPATAPGDALQAGTALVVIGMDKQPPGPGADVNDGSSVTRVFSANAVAATSQLTAGGNKKNQLPFMPTPNRFEARSMPASPVRAAAANPDATRSSSQHGPQLEDSAELPRADFLAAPPHAPATAAAAAAAAAAAVSAFAEHAAMPQDAPPRSPSQPSDEDIMAGLDMTHDAQVPAPMARRPRAGIHAFGAPPPPAPAWEHDAADALASMRLTPAPNALPPGQSPSKPPVPALSSVGSSNGMALPGIPLGGGMHAPGAQAAGGAAASAFSHLHAAAAAASALEALQAAPQRAAMLSAEQQQQLAGGASSGTGMASGDADQALAMQAAAAAAYASNNGPQRPASASSSSTLDLFELMAHARASTDSMHQQQAHDNTQALLNSTGSMGAVCSEAMGGSNDIMSMSGTGAVQDVLLALLQSNPALLPALQQDPQLLAQLLSSGLLNPSRAGGMPTPPPSPGSVSLAGLASPAGTMGGGLSRAHTGSSALPSPMPSPTMHGIRHSRHCMQPMGGGTGFSPQYNPPGQGVSAMPSYGPGSPQRNLGGYAGMGGGSMGYGMGGGSPMGSLPSPMHSPANHNPMPYRNLPPSMLGSMGGMPPPPPTSMRGHMGQPNMADIARIGSMEPVDGGAADFLASLGALLGNGSSAGGRMEGGQEPGRSFDDLSQRVRDKVQSVLDHCAPHIRVEHFDAGVRHWLLQLQQLFGEDSAIAALHAIETAANLEGVRRMKAFITTRLIDHYEQMVWSQDPEGYAARKLPAELLAVLAELVATPDKGLKWTHFDPKVLDTIREIGVPDAVRIRLSKLCASELAGVQNTAAYLYTLLSKRGKTAKQAAIAKQAAELQARLVAMQRLGSMGGPMGQMGHLGHHNQLGGLQGMDMATLNALGGGLGGPMGQYGQLGQAHMSPQQPRMQQGGLDLSNLRFY